MLARPAKQFQDTVNYRLWVAADAVDGVLRTMTPAKVEKELISAQKHIAVIRMRLAAKKAVKER